MRTGESLNIFKKIKNDSTIDGNFHRTQEVMAENANLKAANNDLANSCFLSAISSCFLSIFFFGAYKDFFLSRNEMKDWSGSTAWSLASKTFLSLLAAFLIFLVCDVYAVYAAPILAFFVLAKLFLGFFKRVFFRKKN